MFRKASDKDSSFMASFVEAAKDHKGKILFVYSDIEEGLQAKIANQMGVTSDDLPTLRAIIPAGMNKYASPLKAADLTVKEIGAFMDTVLDGTAEEFFKSQPIPKSNKGPITTIVGKEWDKITTDPTKDVFVKIYAPWCQ